MIKSLLWKEKRIWETSTYLINWAPHTILRYHLSCYFLSLHIIELSKLDECRITKYHKTLTLYYSPQTSCHLKWLIGSTLYAAAFTTTTKSNWYTIRYLSHRDQSPSMYLKNAESRNPPFVTQCQEVLPTLRNCTRDETLTTIT